MLGESSSARYFVRKFCLLIILGIAMVTSMRKVVHAIACFLAVSLLFTSCAWQQSRLQSESGLYNVTLTHNPKVALDGVWFWGGGNPFRTQKGGKLYVAPLDISRVQAAQPELAPLMVPQMHSYITKYVGEAMEEGNAATGSNWKLVDSPQDCDVRVDIALVHFRPQRPGLRVLSGLGGHFVKIPGITDVVGRFARGDVRVELTIRDARHNRLLMACKDSNRTSAMLISAEAYKKSGNADVNLRLWAKKLAKLIRYCSPDKLGDGTMEQMIKKRSFWDAAKARSGF